MLWNISFLDVRNFNGFLTRYFPLKELSPTPLHYPLSKVFNSKRFTQKITA